MILMRKEADERFVAYVPIMRAAQECVRKILFQEKPGGKAGNKKARQAGLFWHIPEGPERIWCQKRRQKLFLSF